MGQHELGLTGGGFPCLDGYVITRSKLVHGVPKDFPIVATFAPHRLGSWRIARELAVKHKLNAKPDIQWMKSQGWKSVPCRMTWAVEVK